MLRARRQRGRVTMAIADQKRQRGRGYAHCAARRHARTHAALQCGRPDGAQQLPAALHRDDDGVLWLWTGPVRLDSQGGANAVCYWHAQPAAMVVADLASALTEWLKLATESAIVRTP